MPTSNVPPKVRRLHMCIMCSSARHAEIVPRATLHATRWPESAAPPVQILPSECPPGCRFVLIWHARTDRMSPIDPNKPLLDEAEQLHGVLEFLLRGARGHARVRYATARTIRGRIR